MTIPHFIIKEILNLLFYSSDSSNDEFLNDIIINFLCKMTVVSNKWNATLLPNLRYPVFIINTKRSQRYYLTWCKMGLKLCKIRYQCNIFSQYLSEISNSVTELNSVYNLKYFLQDDRSLNDIILKSQFYNISKLELIVMDGDNGINELKPVYQSNQIPSSKIKDLVITNIGFSSQNINEFENILQDLDQIEKLTLNLESLDEYMCRIIVSKQHLTHLLLFRLNIDIQSLIIMFNHSLPNLEEIEFSNVHIYGNRYIDEILPILNEKKNLTSLKLRLSTHDDFLGDCNRIKYSNLVEFLNTNNSIQKLLLKIQCVDYDPQDSQQQQQQEQQPLIINNSNIRNLSFIVASHFQQHLYNNQNNTTTTNSNITQFLKQQQCEMIFQNSIFSQLDSISIISPLDRKIQNLVNLNMIKDLSIGGYVGPNIVQDSYLPIIYQNSRNLIKLELRGNQSVKSSQWDIFLKELVEKNDKIEILNLIDIGVSQPSLIKFFESNHKSIKHLSIQTLQSNFLSKDITESLVSNHTLTSLQISRLFSNKHLDENLECLVRIITENQCLLHLDFTRNLQISTNINPNFPSTSQIQSLTSSIRGNKSLLSLSIDLYQHSDSNSIKEAFRDSMITPIYSPPQSCK